MSMRKLISRFCMVGNLGAGISYMELLMRIYDESASEDKKYIAYTLQKKTKNNNLFEIIKTKN